MDPDDRMTRLALTEVRKSVRAGGRHGLEQCTPQSFAGALMTASAMGLEPGVGGECYLIPYGQKGGRVECQLVIGYQGIVKLFWQHPRAEYFDAQWVGGNDHFKYVKGLNPVLEHVHATADRGAPVLYYGIAKAAGAKAIWDVFTPAEIAKLRRGKIGPSGDIPDPQRWMERKTALRQVLKLAPKTARLDLAIRADEGLGSDLFRERGISLEDVPPHGDYVDGEVLPEEPEPQP